MAVSVTYSINGVNLKTGYGVRVKAARGLLGAPQRKDPEKYTFPESNGYIPDMSVVAYKERSIQLQCYILSASATVLATAYNTFTKAMYNVTALVPLLVKVGSTTIFDGNIRVTDISDLTYQFTEGTNVGTFTISIEEPNPVV